MKINELVEGKVYSSYVYKYRIENGMNTPRRKIPDCEVE